MVEPGAAFFKKPIVAGTVEATAATVPLVGHCMCLSLDLGAYRGELHLVVLLEMGTFLWGLVRGGHVFLGFIHVHPMRSMSSLRGL